MKLDLSRRRSRWSSFVSSPARPALILLSLAVFVFAQDDAKTRIKNIKEQAKQGPTAIDQIAASLSDPDLSVRREAVKAIVDLDTQRSLDPLVKATADNDPEIQQRATDGLVNFYLPGYIQSGISAPFKKIGTKIKSRFTDTNDQVVDPSVEVRPEIVQALGKLASGGASTDSRAGAARALGILRGRAAVPELLQALASNDTDVDYEALVALEKIGDKSVGPKITFRLKDPSEKVQIAAIEATGVLDNKAAVYQVRDVMDRSKSGKVKKAGLTTLAMIPDQSSHGVFILHLEDKDEGMRIASLEGLARLRQPSDEGYLKSAFNDAKKQPVRMAGAFGLVNLGQRDMGEFSPLRYLVNQLNSANYRNVARSYLIELTRDPATRQAVLTDLDQAPSKDEKTGIAQVLGASGDSSNIPALEKLSKDPDSDVARESLRAIQNIRARSH